MARRRVSPLVGILGHWIRDPAVAAVQPVYGGSGFSGARLWRVTYCGEEFVLRSWPAAMTEQSLVRIHKLQGWLAQCGLPVAAPVGASETGRTFVRDAGAVWEMSPWLPGVADCRTDPRPERLAAALRVLAKLHVAASNIPAAPMPQSEYHRVSPALMLRSQTLGNLVLTGGRNLRKFLPSIRPGIESRLAAEALDLVEQTAPGELEKSARWESEPLRLQMCLRDVWHDHVLFTGDRVTGVIDFGAAAFDSPTGDVARLLGSMVGDDRERWRQGLVAYELVRPLSTIEHEAMRYFDTSGTVLSAANWIRWLAEDPSALPPTVDRVAAWERLRGLVERLKVLVAA